MILALMIGFTIAVMCLFGLELYRQLKGRE